jgi:hypothetical protein
LTHFLKKGAILEFEPVIKQNTQLLCKHFSAAVNTNEPLELHAAFHCYTIDTLSQHAFGRDLGFHYLDEPYLTNTWKTRINSMFEFCRVIRHFNFVGRIANTIPRAVSLAVPRYAHVYSMEKVCYRYLPSRVMDVQIRY